MIAADGAVHELDPRSIGEAPVEQSPNVWSDRKTLRAPLPAVRPGCVAETEVVLRETQPMFAQGVVKHFVLSPFYPVRKLRLIIDFPAQLPLRYEVRGTDLKPVRTEKNGQVRLVFEPRSVKPLKIEDMEFMGPPEIPLFPQVIFSTGKSWKDVAAGYEALVERQMDLDAVKAMAREAVGAGPAGSRPPRGCWPRCSSSSAIRAWNSATRPSSAASQGNPGPPLWRLQGPGDVAGGHAAGGRFWGPRRLAEVGWTLSDEQGPAGTGRFQPCHRERRRQPDPLARSHEQLRSGGAVARVGPGLLGPGRVAAVPKGWSRRRWPTIVRTAARLLDYFLDDGPGCRVRETIEVEGSCGADMRAYVAAQNEEDLRKSWQDYMVGRYFAKSLLASSTASPQDLTKPFRIVAEAADSKLVAAGDDKLTASIFPGTVFQILPATLLPEAQGTAEGTPSTEPPRKDRKAPLLLPEPRIDELVFQITPPPGFMPGPLPANELKHFGPMAFSRQFGVIGDVVTATFRLDTGPGKLTAAEVNAIRRDLAEVGPKGDLSRWIVPRGVRLSGGEGVSRGAVERCL